MKKENLFLIIPIIIFIALNYYAVTERAFNVVLAAIIYDTVMSVLITALLTKK